MVYMLENMCVLAGISCVFCGNLLNDYGLKLMVSKCGLYAGKYVCVGWKFVCVLLEIVDRLWAEIEGF